MSGPYAIAAPLYRAQGWQGVLPVGNAPSEKWPPPAGYTGREGRWPTDEDVERWRSERSAMNIAIRLPRGVVGIDVDDYGDKPGADTMLAAVAAHGSPPRTWRSTSRDGLSGIRLYRIAPDLELAGDLRHPERPDQSGVELVQAHHRYVVVAPSIHPDTGATYRWIDPDEATGDIPEPDRLPELPRDWIDHLAGSCACYARGETSIRMKATSGADPVADAKARALAAINGPGSTHQGVAGAILELCYWRNRRHPDAVPALQEVHDAFLADVTRGDRPSGRRTPLQAEQEWTRLVDWYKAGKVGLGEPEWETPQPRPEPTFARGDDGSPAPSEAAQEAPGSAFPEPEDRGRAVLSDLGETEYVEDLIRPGRILLWAAEEGTGKSYAVDSELGIRLAVAGGKLAETWPILRTGPVLYLSEMHGDDDYAREDVVLASLNRTRADLQGRYFRLPLMTAAGDRPPLQVAEWRRWIAGWLRERGALLLIFDTATGATQVDPWGAEIQGVYRELRAMLEIHPALAVVLIVHLKKPSAAKGDRRLSDVLGEWGRWCDVVVLHENDGSSLERAKLTVRKRVRKERRLSATKRGGLLVDPIDLTDAKPATKVADREGAILAALALRNGLTYEELGAALTPSVTGATAKRYVKASGDKVRVASGGRENGRQAPDRVFLPDDTDDTDDMNACRQPDAGSTAAEPTTDDTDDTTPIGGVGDVVVSGPAVGDEAVDLVAEAHRIWGDEIVSIGAPA